MQMSDSGSKANKIIHTVNLSLNLDLQVSDIREVSSINQS